MKWILTKQLPLEKEIESVLNVEGIKFHRYLIRHLASIGVSGAELKDFLQPTEALTHDPYLLKGMKELVENLFSDIKAGKKIVVYGDYDADGVTSTAILELGLGTLGANVTHYIPTREQGYGMKVPGTETIAKEGAEIVLTCDNGIAAFEAIERAKELGLRVYVTDHHLPQKDLPVADIIVNPHQADCPYPFKEISGAMIAYKLVKALFEKFGRAGEEVEYMPLVALSTIADVMPLRGENRYYVLEGLRMIQKDNCSEGIRALLKVLAADQKRVDESTVGYFLGPLLNAPGRMGDAAKAFEALSSKDKIDAIVAANICKKMNEDRKVIVDEGTREVMPQVVYGQPNILSTSVTEGVVGILAGQISELTASPTLVGRADSVKNTFKGSARSVPGYSLFEMFTDIHAAHPEYFVAWGGHDAAAGFTLHLNHFDNFKEAMNEWFEDKLKNSPEPSRSYVGQVKSDKEINWIARSSDLLKPFGEANRSPVYAMEGVIDEVSKFGTEGQHLSFKMNGFSFKRFRAEHFVPVSEGDVVKAYFTIETGYFMGRKQVNLFLEDVEVA